MGKVSAAIVGFTEWKPARKWKRPMFALEAMAQLTSEVLADAQLEKGRVDGIVIADVPESPMFAPSAVAEYLNIESNFNETVDLGGASPAGMVWRAAAAIEAGVCECVLVLCPGVPAPPDPAGVKDIQNGLAYMGGDAWGSPQAQFEIPAGLAAAVPSYAMAAQRYNATYGLEETVLAGIAVSQRDNAQKNPDAIFYGKPITVDDVMGSPMLADPIKKLEAVMICFGGAGLLVTKRALAEQCPHRPIFIAGYGEHLTHKSITNMPDFLVTPISNAADRAFRMAGADRKSIDLACFYDSFTITVLLAIENAGFCKPGQANAFLQERDIRINGDFPINTHGGMLSFGQTMMAGGMSHFTEAVRQLQGRAYGRQLTKCDKAFCSGSGGMLSEQIAVILEGA